MIVLERISPLTLVEEFLFRLGVKSSHFPCKHQAYNFEKAEKLFEIFYGINPV